MSDRTVHTDAVATLGQIIDETQKRDAIHLATEPVVAAEKLFPGQDVGILDGQGSARATKLVGIVDPFLKGPVFPGQRFWLIVYPRQITSLRHTWEHPDFPDAVAKATMPEITPSPTVENTAFSRMSQIVEDAGFDFGDVMRAARDYEGDSQLYVYGDNKRGYLDVDEGFWDDYNAITGQNVTFYTYDDGCRGC